MPPLRRLPVRSCRLFPASPSELYARSHRTQRRFRVFTQPRDMVERKLELAPMKLNPMVRGLYQKYLPSPRPTPNYTLLFDRPMFEFRNRCRVFAMADNVFTY